MFSTPFRLTLMMIALGTLVPNPALAYIGPGAGLGAIAVTLALIVGLVLLLVGLVWYPLKRLLKKKSKNAVSDENDSSV